MLLPLLSATALASGAPDCRLTEADYAELRATLRDMRRATGQRLVVAGDTPRCASALKVVATNDPLLGVQVVRAPEGGAVHAVEIDLYRSHRACGAALTPAGDGWTLVDVGQCTQSAEPYRLAVTAGYWNPGARLSTLGQRNGLSARINGVINPGLSALADVSAELTVSPRDLDASLLNPLSWRVMGGFDATREQLAGGYLGFRGGLQHLIVDGDPDRSAIFQSVLGHRFIGRGGVLQVGGGVQVSVPTGDYVAERGVEITPLAEIRLGIAP
ncbi:MAG: hypothetical protein R3F59_23270 [Myxococcota bacterium]